MSGYQFDKGSVDGFISPKDRDTYVHEIAENLLADCRKVLLVPPDITRIHSGVGNIIAYLYRHFSSRTQFDIIPALGTHSPMTPVEIESMFGQEIPLDRFFPHYWRRDLKHYGEISNETLSKIFGQDWRESMPVTINKQIETGGYDLILSLGQVVPHEVVGMANYTKNILIGLGGEEAIHQSHFLSALYGIEKIMGRIDNPVRRLLNLAFDRYLSHLPIQFLYTVTEKFQQKSESSNEKEGEAHLKGLYVGAGQSSFTKAATLSKQCNLTLLHRPIKKAVVYLMPEQFKSTWLGNKAIYRLRMAMSDDGELFILSPGLRQFGEDKTIDSLIRQYGYIEPDAIREKIDSDELLKKNLSTAAHLIHGSSNGRFKITYCPGPYITQKEIQGAGFEYLSYKKAIDRFKGESLIDGYNKVPNEGLVFYVSNPAMGLWALFNQFPEMR